MLNKKIIVSSALTCFLAMGLYIANEEMGLIGAANGKNTSIVNTKEVADKRTCKALTLSQESRGYIQSVEFLNNPEFEDKKLLNACNLQVGFPGCDPRNLVVNAEELNNLAAKEKLAFDFDGTGLCRAAKTALENQIPVEVALAKLTKPEEATTEVKDYATGLTMLSSVAFALKHAEVSSHIKQEAKYQSTKIAVMPDKTETTF